MNAVILLNNILCTNLLRSGLPARTGHTVSNLKPKKSNPCYSGLTLSHGQRARHRGHSLCLQEVLWVLACVCVCVHARYILECVVICQS